MLRNRGDSKAVEALQQIWLFAENARAWEFPNWSREFVAAVGSVYGKADLADLLTETGFLDVMPGGGFSLHDFAEHNAKLIQRWENGRFGKLGARFGFRGGRPRSKQETPDEPAVGACDNPRETPSGGSGKPPVVGPKTPPTRPDQTRPGNTLGENVAHESDGASAKPKRSTSKESVDDASWLKGLETEPTYAGIDVRLEFGKMSRWCEANRKRPTRRRFVNWLNRVDRPIRPNGESGVGIGGIAAMEAELQRLERNCRESMLEAQRPENQRRIAELRSRIASSREEVR